MFTYLKNILRFVCLFLVCLFYVSCQNLQQKKKALPDHLTEEKKEPVLSPVLSSTPITPPIIDKNDSEVQADTAFLKGEKALFHGQTTKALRYFKQALLLAPHSNHLLKKIAEIYEKEGFFSEALHLYKKLSQKTTNNKEFLQKIIEIYKRKGLDKKAFEIHTRLLKKEPHRFSLILEQALFLIHQENKKEALKILKTAEIKATTAEEKAQTILAQAFIFSQFQETYKSLKIMKKLNNLKIREEAIVLKIAELYQFLNQPLLAIQHLENFQKNWGFNKSISESLLKHYTAIPDWEKVHQHLNQIQAMGDLKPDYYFYKGMLLVKQKNYDKALTFFKDLIAQAPRQGQYLYFLAFIYEQKKEWFPSLKIYNQVPKTSPLFLAAKLKMTQILKQLGRKKESFALLRKLSFSDEGMSSQALLVYAESLWTSGQKKEALQALIKGLSYKPFQADLLLLKNRYLKSLKKEDIAFNLTDV